jgi:hypothetical protein
MSYMHFCFQNLSVHMTRAFCRSSDDYDDPMVFAVPISEMIIVIVNVLTKVMPVDSFSSMAHKLTLLQQALINQILGCDDQQQHSSVEMKCIRLSSSHNPYISPASSPLGTSKLRILLAFSTLFSQSRPCPDINGAKVCCY